MAKVYLEIAADTSVLAEVGQGMEKVSTSAKKAGADQTKAFKEAADSVDKLNASLKDSTPTVNLKNQKSALQALKDEIKQYENAAIRAGEGTAEFARNIALAGKRKADLKDLKQAVDALDPDRVAKGFLGLARTIAGGFTLAQSATALLGKENKDLEKTLLRVQAAQGVLAALQELANTKDELMKVKIIGLQYLQLANTKLQTAAESESIVVRNLAIVAQGALNAVTSLGAGGVLLLVGGVATLVAGLSKWSDGTESVAEAEKRLNDELERSNTISASLINQTEAYIALRKAQGSTDAQLADFRKANFELQQKQFNDEINNNNSIIKKLEERNKEEHIGNSEIQENLQKIQELRDKNFVADSKRFVNETRFKAQELELENQAYDKLAELAKKKADLRKQEAEKEFEIFKEKQKKLNDALQLIPNIPVFDNLVKKGNEAVDAALKVSNTIKTVVSDTSSVQINAFDQLFVSLSEFSEKYAQFIDEIQQGIDLIGQLQQIETENRIKDIDFETKSRLDGIDAEIELRKKQHRDFEDLETQKKKIQEDADDRVKKLQKEQFERNKKYQKANAVINGAQSILKTYSEYGFTPAGIAAALLDAAIVALQIAVIDKQEFYKGGYTGDGPKYGEAGTVHYGEFVSKKETTQKHRNLLEALHNENYSMLGPADLAPLLQGTGVVLKEDVPIRINQAHDSMRLNSFDATPQRLASMEKEMKDFFRFYKGKPIESTAPDGSKIIKDGNTTRRIKKKD